MATMSSTMKNPSVLEEFSFSDDEGSQDTHSGHGGNSGHSGNGSHDSHDPPPKKKSRNTIAVQSGIGSPCSSKASWQKDEKKILMKNTLSFDNSEDWESPEST